MSYFHLAGESNQDRHARLEREYAAYVADAKAQGKEIINYMNWVTSKKFIERIARGDKHVFERRHSPRTDLRVEDKPK